LRFDRFALDLTRGCLRTADQNIDLPPKPFEVLRHLVENAGRLVPKKELLDTVWPNVSVSDDSLVQCIRELRQALGDDEHRLIKTVSRRGYLLDAMPHPIAVGTVAAERAPIVAAVTATDGLPGGGLRRVRWSVGISTSLLVAAVVLTGVLWATWSRIVVRSSDPTERYSSLVILPFRNVGGDPEQEYFVDGVTDALQTGMSWIPGKLVARSTAFTYKEKVVDVREIGRDLDVRYVLEGTVHASGDRARVTAQLIDASSAASVWNETFDVDRRDLVGLRDDVTARLASSLRVGLVYAVAARSLRERPHDPEAVDFLLRANAQWYRARPGRDVLEARRLYREALQRDASLTLAWVGLAQTYVRNVRFSSTREQDLMEAGAAAERAIALEPGSHFAHVTLGWVRYERKNMDQALASFEHAVQLNGNEPDAHAGVAATNVLLGQPENALEPLRKALRLSPKDPSLSTWQMIMGAVCLHLRRDGEAVDWLHRSVALAPTDAFARLFLASALALSGREDDARAQLAELLRLRPDFTLSRFKAVEPSDLPAFRAQRERIYEGLRRAGVPE
jgi:TolB-like protein/DNA-binding winged helix-turn-helix (wHTH) protein/cytochrome c-type biogenesis protein CcmH/NrfG